MKKTRIFGAALGSLALVLTIGLVVDWSSSESRARPLWQQAVDPGSLSQSHVFLANNCAACHTPVKGVEPALCIACHADNTALLQRQPTAFHANVQVCSGCHVEHQGTARMPTRMDHSLLAKVGHGEIKVTQMAAPPSSSEIESVAKLLPGAPDGLDRPREEAASFTETKVANVRDLPASHPRLSAGESALSCVSCHATKDRHQGLFGTDCFQCHDTAQWTVAQFLHPSARSTECAQCHKPPPSHHMMHFSMMSQPLARQPNAKVNQCFLCHQTTHWNDIKGVGRIKHH